MSERLRRILASVLFTAGAFALLFVLTGILKPITYSRDTWRDYKALAPNSVDVIVVGNSHAYTSFAPMQVWRDYGITTWNIGAPAINMRTKRAYVEELLKTQTPEVLALEVYSVDTLTQVEDQQNRWAYDFMPMGLPRVKATMDTALPTMWERYLVSIVNYHQNYSAIRAKDVALFLGVQDDPSRGGANALSKPAKDKGEVAAAGNAQGIEAGANGDDAKGDTTASEDSTATEAGELESGYQDSVSEIRRIADMCAEKDIKLVLWLSPVQDDSYSGAKSPLLKLESDLRNDYPEITYVNASERKSQIGLVAADHRDWGHLYAWGMKKHTAWFVENVLADLGITGPSDTPDAAWWDRESAQWNPPSSLAEADAQEGDN